MVGKKDFCKSNVWRYWNTSYTSMTCHLPPWIENCGIYWIGQRTTLWCHILGLIPQVLLTLGFWIKNLESIVKHVFFNLIFLPGPVRLIVLIVNPYLLKTENVGVYGYYPQHEVFTSFWTFFENGGQFEKSVDFHLSEPLNRFVWHSNSGLAGLPGVWISICGAIRQSETKLIDLEKWTMLPLLNCLSYWLSTCFSLLTVLDSDSMTFPLTY